MYLKKLHLKNIKCFEDVTLEFPHRGGDYSGWNVILGVNGAGKSTLLIAIADAIIRLVGSNWLDDDQWVSHRATEGAINVEILETQFDDHAPNARAPSAERDPTDRAKRKLYSRVTRLPFHHGAKASERKTDNTPGWLACGYGPFRRLADNPPTPLVWWHDPFRTLLLDDQGLSEPFRWLQTVYGKSLDPKVKNRAQLQHDFPIFLQMINGLLPEPVRIADVSTEAVAFTVLGEVPVAAAGLSDGYRSFLALAVDLLMRVYLATDHFAQYVEWEKGSQVPRITAEGIVLIDEADAHLHPSWQRELGQRLCQVFPKIQFIVTTHSPFIAQEATDGGLFVLKATDSGAVVVEQPVESVRGWTASQILTGPLFGLDSTRDPETEEKIRESAALNAKKQGNTKLTAAEKKRLAELRNWLTKRLTAPGETYEEMLRREEMNAYIDQKLKRLKNGQP